MLYIIAFLIVFLIILIVLTIVKDSRATLDIMSIIDNDKNKTVEKLAYMLRNVKSMGKSLSIYHEKTCIYKAFKIISKKIKNKVHLRDGEKWLYDNFNLILEYLMSNRYTKFIYLPHIKNNIRIVELALFIVNSGSGMLSLDNIDEIISRFIKITPLSHCEVLALKDAIIYVYMIRLSNISLRIINDDKMKRKSFKDDTIDVRYMNSDSYMYYFIKKHPHFDENHNIYSKLNRSKEEIILSYETIIYEDSQEITNIIKSLRDIDYNLSDEHILNYDRINNRLMQDVTYARSDVKTKYHYINEVICLAQRFNVSEKAIINACFALSDEKMKHFGVFLFNESMMIKAKIKGREHSEKSLKDNVMSRVYVSIILLSTFLITSILSIVLYSDIYSLLLVVPIFMMCFKMVEYIVNKSFRHIVRKRAICKLNLDKVEDKNATQVIFSEYFKDNNDINRISNKINSLNFINKDSNISFTLLCDFKSKGEEWTVEDDNLLDYLKSKIDSNINIFVRKRTKRKNRFIAWERKRGAILDLFEYFIKDRKDKFKYIRHNEKYVKYAILLDEDSEVLPNSFVDMINTITHPVNERYDMMTISSRYNLYSINTLYSRKYLQNAGNEMYGNYSSLMYDISSFGIFQGKGIVDIRRFYNTIKDNIQDGRVLSHDILEGSMLSTGELDGNIFEDAPSNIVSETTRNIRWLRGDYLLLPFARNRQETSKNKKSIIKKPLIYKYLMYSNVISPLRDISTLCMLILSLSISNYLLLGITLTLYFLPKLVDILYELMMFGKDKKTRYIIKEVVATIVTAIFDIFLLPFTVFKQCNAILITFLRRMLHMDIFKWKTYSESQGILRFRDFVRFTIFYGLFSVFIMILALLYNNIAVFSYILRADITLFVTYFLGSSHIERKKIYKKNYYKDVATKTYGYFSKVNKNAKLIPDNLEISPNKGNSSYTSPTNIGFSLLAEISAYYLEILDIDTSIDRIESILKSISHLDRYKGNFYNWYDVNSQSPLPPHFISSVDNGNLLASLITVRGFLIDKNCDTHIVDTLICEMDLSIYYIEDRNIFAIGYDLDKNELVGNYDLLASEARLFNYLACISTNNRKTYQNLGRKCTSLHGNMLYSWSGTMFEYFMPSLFIDDPRFSLMSNTLRGAIKCQIKSKFKGLYGVSESGYCQFDNNLYYLYHAFGLNDISLRNEVDKGVISPYSSILAIKYAPRACYKNLIKLNKLDMYGDLGYYEAYDTTRDNGNVYSYMSHHQGMVLVSLVNYLYDDIIKKHFMSYPLVMAGKTLLLDNIVKSKCKKKISSLVHDDYTTFEYKKVANYKTKYPSCNFLTNGIVSLFTDDIGNNYQYIDGKYISKVSENDSFSYGGIFYLEHEGRILCPTINKMRNGDISGYRSIFTQDKSVFVNENDGVSVTFEVPFGLGSVKKTLTIKNTSNQSKKYKVAYVEELMMLGIDAYYSHPAYEDMFVDTYLDEVNSCIVARRRDRHSKDAYFSLCYANGLRNMRYDSNLINVVGRYKRVEDIDNINISRIEPSFGDVLKPCYYIDGEVDVGPKSEVSIEVYTIAHKDKRVLLDELYSIKNKNSILGGSIASLNTVYDYISSCSDYEFMLKLASKIKYDKSKSERKKIVYLGGKHDDEYVRLIRIRQYLELFDIHFDIDYVDGGIDNDLDNKTSNAYLVLKTLNIEDMPLINGERYKYEEGTMRKVRRPSLVFSCQYGGFDMNNDFVVTNRTLRPYSNVVCMKYGGFVATENGVMYSYFGNSRENKTTYWSNDYMSDFPSERVYLIDNNHATRINQGYDRGYTIHGVGYTKYVNSLDGFDVEVTRGLIYDGLVQVVDIALDNVTSSHNTSLIFDSDMAIGVRYTRNISIDRLSDNMIRCINLVDKKEVYYKALDSIYLLDGLRYRYDRYNTIRSSGDGASLCFGMDVNVKKDKSRHVYIVISENIDALEKINITNINIEIDKAIAKYNRINKWEVATNDKLTDILFNKWLLYQVMSSRFFGRTAFYQAGGAVGFRDQLQDCLAIIYSYPDIVRQHILRAAAHQYEEGDVMHWWHPPYFGIRTRISDDRLFLPYVTYEYIKVTGDRDILSAMVKYIVSPTLQDNENSRLEHANVSKNYGTLLEHIIRAIDVSLDFGEHGLSLIRGGDWNDALDMVGQKGKGESVWLSMFLYDILMKSLEYVDTKTAVKYRDIATKLKASIEKTYLNERYARAYADDGTWLGSEDSDVSKIDTLSQSFAVLSHVGDIDMNNRALNSCDRLIDRENRLMRLLSPSYDRYHYYGYISSYPEGMRENGGQYTHAAIWYIMAKYKIGKRNEAKELFDMISPIRRIESDEDMMKYKVEPYVMSADIYSNVGHEGQGGWSWYTGSAAWTYKYLLNMVYGIDKVGNMIVFDKRKGDSLNDYTMKYQYKSTKYVIHIRESKRHEVLIDGLKGKYVDKFELADDGKTHIIDYYY